MSSHINGTWFASDSPLSSSFPKPESLVITPPNFQLLCLVPENNKPNTDHQPQLLQEPELSPASATSIESSIAQTFMSNINASTNSSRNSHTSYVNSFPSSSEGDNSSLEFLGGNLGNCNPMHAYGSSSSLRPTILSEMERLTLQANNQDFLADDVGTFSPENSMGSSSSQVEQGITRSSSPNSLPLLGMKLSGSFSSPEHRLPTSRFLLPTANNPFGIQPRKKRGRPRKAVSLGPSGLPHSRSSSLITKLCYAIGMNGAGGPTKRDTNTKRLARSFTSGIDNRQSLQTSRWMSSDLDVRNRTRQPSDFADDTSILKNTQKKQSNLLQMYDRAYSSPILNLERASFSSAATEAKPNKKQPRMHPSTSSVFSPPTAAEFAPFVNFGGSGTSYSAMSDTDNAFINNEAEISAPLNIMNFHRLSDRMGIDNSKSKSMNDLDTLGLNYNLMQNPNTLGSIPRVIVAKISSKSLSSSSLALNHSRLEAIPPERFQNSSHNIEIRQKLAGLEQLAYKIRHGQILNSDQNTNLETLEAMIYDLSSLLNSQTE